MNKRRILVACALMLALPAQAQVYKWTDKNGEVHYGDNPGASNAKTVDTSKTFTSTVAPEDASRRKQEQRLLNSMDEERAQDAKAQARQQKLSEEKAQRCSDSRSRLALIRQSSTLFHETASGQRVAYTDEQRRQLTAQAEAAVKRYCGDSGD